MKDKNKDLDQKTEKATGRKVGNNTEDNQRAEDNMGGGNKGEQQQGNRGSRQGEGGNRGKRGNTGLG